MHEGVGAGMEGAGSRSEGYLWDGYGGVADLPRLAPYCIIDRCAASIRDLEFRVRGGGIRTYGLRPLTPEDSTQRALRGFFQELQASVERDGVRLPILLWGIGGKLYTRYGASRVFVSRNLGLLTIPAVLCNFDRDIPAGFTTSRILTTPAEVLEDGFGGPSVVGDFEHSYERLDAHRFEL